MKLKHVETSLYYNVDFFGSMNQRFGVGVKKYVMLDVLQPIEWYYGV